MLGMRFVEMTGFHLQNIEKLLAVDAKDHNMLWDLWDNLGIKDEIRQSLLDQRMCCASVLGHGRFKTRPSQVIGNQAGNVGFILDNEYQHLLMSHNENYQSQSIFSIYVSTA